MQNKFLWSLTLPLLAINSISVPQVLAAPVNSDSLCYIQLDSIKKLDLTSICGFSSRQNTTYLAEVQQLIKGFEGDKQLLELLNNNHSLLIDAAKSYCKARLEGMSEQEIYETKHREIMQGVQDHSLAKQDGNANRQFETSLTAMSMASNIASKVYCPSVTAW
ncbi:hypothetical protein QUB80_02225 [Chlorogloeopsis sp. ULAP01]|uniref:hypothetical protein n=1 Tax=Chlorogloeopsis sp. ULAP01 TaxID=3056483 RepID=UPI0025AAE6B3|nr:hypothetical protein [Chlorogloeopsis sp. ULAP01]MDM9379517.1 hypothetical protein [Chlorogloeopsis sp. ULAP01]